ncbi:unnamed protein product [Phytomonas sp. EM1]|nr:unnamed protein product [Phytomonas sp. EM1]|eukprot:CCW62206.1 unnamed protein product [Phytomonas sp. isolate EM1]
MTRRHARRERERFIVLHVAMRIYIEQTQQQQQYFPEEFLYFLTHTSRIKDAKSSLPHQIGDGILCSLRRQLAWLGGLRYTDPDMLTLYQAAWEGASIGAHTDTRVVEGLHSKLNDSEQQEPPGSSKLLSCVSGVMKIILCNQGVHGKAAEQLMRAVSACLREVHVSVVLPTTSGPETEEEGRAGKTNGGKGASSVSRHGINSIPLRLLVALRVLKYQ